MFASLCGGLRAGLVATALSAVFVDYFWITPMRFAVGQPSDWLAMMIFLLSGAMMAGVSGSMHRARASAFAAEKQALLATERATAAEALQEGRAKLEAALASMTDAVFISDVQGRFIDFNDAFATFHKFRNKDECAKTFAEYPDILDVFMADGTPAPLDQWAVPRALRGETATNAEYTLRRKDTGETWVGSYSFGPIRNKDGGIVGSVVTARDITEHKRIEDAQLFLIKQSGTPSSEDFFMSLARYLGETLGTDYVCIDRLLNDNLSAQTVAIYFDGKYEDNVTYTLKDTPCGDVVGKAICCFPKDVSKLFPNDAVLQEMKAESYAGVTLWSFQGKPIGLIAVIGRKPLANPKLVESILRLMAISAATELERRDMEVELKKHADQLEASNKEMESFSYSVSHDLRSPLRAIDGYTRMILRKQGDQFDEDTTSKFNLIRENARMMGQLIDDLLTLSRLGRQELSKSQLNMEELNKDVLEELKAINPDKAIDLKIGHLPLGLGDRSLIKQVLVNLLSNAIKFTKIREVTFIELGGYVIETENVYYVRDNGVGFDMQYHDKLFGVFQRLHSAADYEGTGVGLSIVQRIINRHGGRVWAESEPDKGATFYFSLPTCIESDR
jgi:signal transduction histidine kinase/PAS domain-containing protein